MRAAAARRQDGRPPPASARTEEPGPAPRSRPWCEPGFLGAVAAGDGFRVPAPAAPRLPIAGALDPRLPLCERTAVATRTHIAR